MYFLIFARKVWRALSEIGSKKELISREKPAVCPHSTTVWTTALSAVMHLLCMLLRNDFLVIKTVPKNISKMLWRWEHLYVDFLPDFWLFWWKASTLSLCLTYFWFWLLSRWDKENVAKRVQFKLVRLKFLLIRLHKGKRLT